MKELQRKFRGDDQWMLPSVSKKIDELAKSSSSKKKEKKSKKSKKSTKKHKKDRKKSKKKKRSASSESDDSSAEERISKKKRKRKHLSDASSGSSSSSDDSDQEEDEWVEKDNGHQAKVDIESKKPTQTAAIQREDWLSGLASIKTFSKPAPDELNERKKEERKGIDSYDPGKSVRELNPHWRDGGDGLPKFAKPNYDSDSNDGESRRSYRQKQNERERSSNWKKKSDLPIKPSTSTSAASASNTAGSSRTHKRSSSSSSSSRSPTPEPKPKPSEGDKFQASRDDFLTDHQMNELGAKLIKAEMMGNNTLAEELKEKLERARTFRKEHKREVLTKSFERRTPGAIQQQNRREKDENVVLTTTNSKGQSRPVASFRDDSDLWGGRAGRKAKKQKAETHLDGERVRYFADDDKYDIKQMVIFPNSSFSICCC